MELKSRRIEKDNLVTITRTLRNQLSSSADLKVDFARRQSDGTDKGPLKDGAKLAFEFIKSDAIPLIIDTINGYFKRESTLEMEFERPDGKKLKLNAKNFSSESIEQTRQMAREFFED
jgi:hypothetical protein